MRTRCAPQLDVLESVAIKPQQRRPFAGIARIVLLDERRMYRTCPPLLLRPTQTGAKHLFPVACGRPHDGIDDLWQKLCREEATGAQAKGAPARVSGILYFLAHISPPPPPSPCPHLLIVHSADDRLIELAVAHSLHCPLERRAVLMPLAATAVDLYHSERSGQGCIKCDWCAKCVRCIGCY